MEVHRLALSNKKRAIKARRKLNKEAYNRFRRYTAMQAKKTAARITSFAAVEIVFLIVLFCFL